MTFESETAARRRELVAEVARLARGVGAALPEARAVGLPAAPGVSEARGALVKWAKLLEEIVPPS